MSVLSFYQSTDVHLESDIAAAIRIARHAAEQLGFNRTEVGYISTAAAELASNLFVHAKNGEFGVYCSEFPPGITLQTRDDGPGIANVELALSEGFSTAGGLGCGLPGVKRLMDNLEIQPRPEGGTVITAQKWK
ncbi:ATP-binding protein [Limnobacter sp.]|uniref:ATP-binding protein n=1 Tax=Limnobacter sp. TaxID=2003368 RepID=UPI003511D50C